MRYAAVSVCTLVVEQVDCRYWYTHYYTRMNSNELPSPYFIQIAKGKFRNENDVATQRQIFSNASSSFRLTCTMSVWFSCSGLAQFLVHFYQFQFYPFFSVRHFPFDRHFESSTKSGYQFELEFCFQSIFNFSSFFV